MIGGSSPNPFDSMDDTKLTDHLMKTDSIFNILNKYFTIYIAINVILVLISLYFAYFQYVIQGVPAAGIEPKTGWDNSGATFLTDFFLLSRQKLGLNPPNITVNPDLLKDFDKNATDLVTEQKPGVELFCNIISPCDICGCTGPDPNYAGEAEDAPLVPYGGAGCVAKETFIEGLSPVPDASIINSYNDTYDYSHRMFGNGLPNCCCHLFDKYKIPSDLPTSKINELMKAGTENNPVNGDEVEKFLDNNFKGIDSLKSLGLPKEFGCEPVEIGKYVGSDGKIVEANNGNYSLAMFQGCLSNKPNKKKPAEITSSDPNNNTALSGDSSITSTTEGKTPYDINIMECFNSDNTINRQKLAADKGISQNFTFRNEDLFTAIKKGRKEAKDPTSIKKALDLTPYIGKLDGTWWKANGGPDWPFDILFIDDHANSVSTKYFYKDDKNRRYELKIDNYLQEVYVDPRKYPKNKNCTIDISTVDITKEMHAFLDFGLNAANDPTFMDNSKNPPVERKTVSKKRYVTKKTGKFIFP
jgi:hypothetical protein